MANPDSVRLSEEQVVEVCAGGLYRTGVCSDNWDDKDATVVCRQLNLGEVGGMHLLLPHVCAVNYWDNLVQLLAPLDLDTIKLL